MENEDYYMMIPGTVHSALRMVQSRYSSFGSGVTVSLVQPWYSPWHYSCIILGFQAIGIHGTTALDILGIMDA